MGTDGRSVEREFKLAAEPDFELPDLRSIVGGTRRLADQRTRAVYFDTPDLRLWHRRITLRHRTGEAPGDGEWTLKLPVVDDQPTLDRTELSWSGARDSMPRDATRLVRGIVRRVSLAEVAVLEATRRRLVLRDERGDTIGELDDDTVTVILEHGANRRFRQIELELGPAGAATAAAVVQALRRAGAEPDPEPKVGKALRMAGRGVEPVGPAGLGGRSSMSEVVRSSIGTAFDRLLDHDVRLRLDASDPAPEDVHQARVATRRLRSDLKLLGGELDPMWVKRTRDELKWLGGVLGSVRDADVLRGSLFGADSVTEAGGTLELRVALDEERRTAARELLATLEDGRYLTLLDRLHAGSTTPPLIRSGHKKRHGGRGRSDGSARKALPSLVKRRLRALRRTVGGAGRHPTDSQLHEIRIRAKQLRYAAETAEPVLGRTARRVASMAEELQTVLGEHHDAVAAEQWLRRQALTGTRSAAFTAGVLVAGERRVQRKLRHRWRPVWARLDRKSVRRSLA